jgi:hypothetical protein
MIDLGYSTWDLAGAPCYSLPTWTGIDPLPFTRHVRSHRHTTTTHIPSPLSPPLSLSLLLQGAHRKIINFLGILASAVMPQKGI